MHLLWQWLQKSPSTKTALLHFYEFPFHMSLIRGSSQVIMHLNSHNECDQIGNLEGAGKAEQLAKDPNKQAVVILVIFRSSQFSASSSDQSLALGVI